MLKFRDKTYSFQYWPPSADPHDVCGGKAPNPPFKGASPHECSGYYYWWLFLRENAAYVATCERRSVGDYADLYRDFGDVRDDSFGRWWTYRGCELFCELANVTVWGDLRPNDWSDLENRTRQGQEFIITVRDDAPLGAAMFEVQAALEQRLKAQTNPKSSSTALYPMFTKPVLTSLHQCYSAHKLRQANPEMHLHEICVQAGLYTAGAKIDPRTAASTASRALKQAKLLIEYAGQGVFPIMTTAQVEGIPAFLADRARNSRQRRVLWNEERKKWRL